MTGIFFEIMISAKTSQRRTEEQGMKISFTALAEEILKEAEMGCCEVVAVNLDLGIKNRRRLEWSLIADVVDRFLLVLFSILWTSVYVSFVLQVRDLL